VHLYTIGPEPAGQDVLALHKAALPHAILQDRSVPDATDWAIQVSWIGAPTLDRAAVGGSNPVEVVFEGRISIDHSLHVLNNTAHLNLPDRHKER
jgi:hypothetical protein